MFKDFFENCNFYNIDILAEDIKNNVLWKDFYVNVSNYPLLLKKIKNSKNAEKNIKIIFLTSPYLGNILIEELDFFYKNELNKADDIVIEIFNSIDNIFEQKNNIELMKKLRILKKRFNFIIAFMEINNIWNGKIITEKLSIFAIKVSNCVLRQLLVNAKNKNVISLKNKNKILENSGVSIIGMGKLGAMELNYSSDIDLIAFYDIKKLMPCNIDKIRNQMTKIIKEFVYILEALTVDGYLFRTDFRLRPSPSVYPIAITYESLLQYYETSGLNWERCAMIKANPVIGDVKLGYDFLSEIKPFVWRKNLDFVALQDIYNIKNKINVHKGYKKECFRNYNVKLGIGGIREIEFFTQCHQLLWGRKNPELQEKSTTSTIEKLIIFDLIDKDKGNFLINSYWYLRKIEHAIQIMHDKQSHAIPSQKTELKKLAVLLNFESVKKFESKTIKIVKKVSAIYETFFDELNIVKKNKNNNVTNLIKEFNSEKLVKNIIKKWNKGNYKTTRSEKSREILETIKPKILLEILKTKYPDKSLEIFDLFLSKLPSGLQFLSLIQSNEKLIEIILDVLCNAPKLSVYMISNPHVIDSLLSNKHIFDVPSEKDLHNNLKLRIKDLNDYEKILIEIREFNKELFFEQGVKVLRKRSNYNYIRKDLTKIANVCISETIKNTIGDFELKNGKIKNSEFAIIAYGKLGSYELMHQSDVDLVFVYDFKNDGSQEISPNKYFLRLTQRIITAISSQMIGGKLFDVDIRLRPNGNKGAIASSFLSFKSYYEKDAWDWEIMAATKARILFSTRNSFSKKILAVLSNKISEKRIENLLKKSILNMREKINSEFKTNNVWNVKYNDGGLIDVEFIIQFLILNNANKFNQILNSSVEHSLDNLYEYKIINKNVYGILKKALHLWSNIEGISRIINVNEIVIDGMSHNQMELLYNTCECKSMDEINEKVSEYSLKVKKIFGTILGT